MLQRTCNHTRMYGSYRTTRTFIFVLHKIGRRYQVYTWVYACAYTFTYTSRRGELYFTLRYQVAPYTGTNTSGIIMQARIFHRVR